MDAGVQSRRVSKKEVRGKTSQAVIDRLFPILTWFIKNVGYYDLKRKSKIINGSAFFQFMPTLYMGVDLFGRNLSTSSVLPEKC
jgi:hypothetical protein